MEPGSKRILMIESDKTVADLLAYNLRRLGYEVLVAGSAPEGLEIGLAQEHDLALVELMLPGSDGLSVGRALAESRPGTPFIITAYQEEPATILQAFAGGADDFVTKPFDFDLLHARIKASLVRHRLLSGVGGPAAPPLSASTISVQATTLDRDTRTLLGPGGQVTVNRKEYALLELFLSEAGRLLTKEEIVQRVWHHHYLPESRTLDAHISRVRGRLRSVRADISIWNVRRIGYRLAAIDGSDG